MGGSFSSSLKSITKNQDTLELCTLWNISEFYYRKILLFEINGCMNLFDAIIIIPTLSLISTFSSFCKYFYLRALAPRCRPRCLRPSNRFIALGLFHAPRSLSHFLFFPLVRPLFRSLSHFPTTSNSRSASARRGSREAEICWLLQATEGRQRENGRTENEEREGTRPQRLRSARFYRQTCPRQLSNF